MGIDDLMRQIEEDERQDSLEVLEYIPIGDFARARGIRPQQVYGKIKSGKIQKYHCPCCGRLAIKVAEANAAFGEDTETTRAGVRVDVMNEEEDDDLQ